jgi:putative membrane protein
MTLSWIIAALHLMGLGVGLGSVFARGMSLRGQLDAAGIRRVLAADTWWAVAAVIWVSTGLTRLFAETDKVTDYYLDNWLFWTKMALFVAIVLHEIRPIITLTRWRGELRAGRTPDTSSAARLARISFIQAAMVVVIVALATGMARGHGMMIPG